MSPARISAAARCLNLSESAKSGSMMESTLSSADPPNVFAVDGA
jgi:hypothetical protein